MITQDADGLAQALRSAAELGPSVLTQPRLNEAMRVGRTRRRRRDLAGVVATVATAVAAVAAVTAISPIGASPTSAVVAPADVSAPTDSAAEPRKPAAAPTRAAAVIAADLTDTHLTPGFLPRGSVLSRQGSTFRNNWAMVYSLPGSANSDEQPGDSGSFVGAGPAHPATTLQIVMLPQSVSTLNRDAVDNRLYDIRAVDIRSSAGTLVTPRNGYGTERVDWVSGGVAYEVSCQRLDTLGEGTSGVSSEELLKVARGIG